MENQGILSRTATPYCSPLTFTLKRDGLVRVLLDAREINKYMIPETEKPPLQLDVINSFHGANFISIVDLNNAYFQIPISETSKKYTGFTFNGKSYVYNVLPQGLKTSVGSFSRAMDIILGHEEEKLPLLEIRYMETKSNKDLLKKLQEMAKMQKEDKGIQELRKKLVENEKTGKDCNNTKGEFVVINDVLYFVPPGTKT
ncbi:reverse transcriptase (RNA-dependent DNA polymerase) domain-containing protein [Phthorimaea operculella]|nr:reverse transcriptase (RNA-dependent DNA polymerase) domain-containing protein [Phthorimaea operculella]